MDFDFNTNALIPFTTAFGAGAGAQFIKPIANIFDNWFYKIYGSKSELERKKIELKNNHEIMLLEAQLEEERNLGLFKNEIYQSLKNIDPVKLTTPNKQNVALIMESSRLYLEVEHVRKMFAELLVANVDSERSDSIHPRHIDIVKNLNQNDAQFLSELSKGTTLYLVSKFFVNFEQEVFWHNIDDFGFVLCNSIDVNHPDIFRVDHDFKICKYFTDSLLNIQNLNLLKTIDTSMFDFELFHSNTDKQIINLTENIIRKNFYTPEIRKGFINCIKNSEEYKNTYNIAENNIDISEEFTIEFLLQPIELNTFGSNFLNILNLHPSA